VTGRDEDRLRALAESVDESTGKIIPIPTDYGQIPTFAADIRNSVTKNGVVASAICWIHSIAPEAPLVVADLIGNRTAPAEYFHILGSTSANPESEDSEVVATLKARDDIKYHQIILGFKLTQDGSRWLTDNEICAGVLHAIRAKEAVYVVGTVTPWSRRP
jgi:hypothetical protein